MTRSVFPRAVRACTCFVCGDTSVMPIRCDAALDRDRYSTYDDRALRVLAYLVCACGAEYTVKIDRQSVSSSSDEFVSRMHDAIDPSTPEQRAAALALEAAAAKTRADAFNTAAELEAKARKLRNGGAL